MMRAATLDATLAALADPTRRRVIDLLHARPHLAGELAEATSMSAPAMSRHLRILREACIVDGDGAAEDKRQKTYRLLPQRFNELRRWVEEIETFWIDQLGAFARHVERSKKGRRR
jgi:DNA-binding transcriptional ArsR family regulator